jgi:predicted phage terminase large subunit-like protein
MDFGFREAIPFKSLTGGRGDRVLIDDPHSTESAESEADRLKTLRIFLESVPSRVNDPEKSAIIIIMQRLHEEDVTGTALAKGLGYTHLMLPMEYDSSRHCTTFLPSGKILFTDPRTEDGELLFPDRFPRAVVERDKIPLGPYGVAGQFQQAPTPRGGGIIRWEWWKLWGNPDDSEDERFKRFPVMKFVVASFDGAFTEKQENDYSALTIWGVFDEDGRDPDEVYVPVIPDHPLQKMMRPGERGVESRAVQNRRFTKLPKTMLMHAWQVRLPLHEVVEKIATTCNRFKVDRLLIEAKGPGISVGQEIRRLHSGEGWSTHLLDPGRLDKIARAYSVQPLFADGMVYAPDREWAELVKDQMAKLGKTAHDDLADSGTQALDHLRKIGLLRHAEEVERELTQTLTSQNRPASKPLYDV